MKTPTTSTTLEKFGYLGFEGTTLRVRFEKKYRAWTVGLLTEAYGRLDVAEDAFPKLVEEIIRSGGIDRTERNRKFRFHTLVRTRAIGAIHRLFRTERTAAQERYEANQRVLGQPTREIAGIVPTRETDDAIRVKIDDVLDLAADKRQQVTGATRFQMTGHNISARGDGEGLATLSGCGTMQTPSLKSQTSSVYAFGLPAVVITHDNKQVSDNSGDDDNFAQSAK